MNRGFVSCIREPGNSGTRERRSLFDDFEIGHRAPFPGPQKWLSNVHFVDPIFSAKPAISQAEDRAVTGSWDRSRPWNQGRGGVGLAQNIQVGRKTFNKDTKQSWLRS